MQTTQAVHQQIKFMPDYRLEIADKLEKLTLTVRNAQAARRNNPFTDTKLHNHESERSGYHFLHMVIRLCSTGTAHHEFRGLCDLHCQDDVRWCREMIATYQRQYQDGLSCMLRQEMAALQHIEQFLSYIQDGIAPDAAIACQQLLHDTSLLVHIADVAFSEPDMIWSLEAIAGAILQTGGAAIDLQDPQVAALLSREFNTIHRASLPLCTCTLQ